MERRDFGGQSRAQVKRRQTLRICVSIGLAAGVLAFAVVFVQGLFGPGLLSGSVLDIGGIAAGTARLDARDGKPVWIVSRSEAQLDGLTALSGHVEPSSGIDPPSIDNPHRSLQRRYGIYLAQTTRSGILVQYTLDRPARLAPDVPWHGGFVDPGSEAVFDVAGRRYRYTWGEPLAVPPHRFQADRVIRLGEW